MNATRDLTLLLVLAVAGCAPDAGDQATETMDAQQAIQEARESLPEEVVAQLDSGSVAFRADDFQGALAHYTRATELAPDFGAAWFGVYMAQQALGNEAAAAEAFEKAQSVEPGATLIHPDGSDAPR